MIMKRSWGQLYLFTFTTLHDIMTTSEAAKIR